MDISNKNMLKKAQDGAQAALNAGWNFVKSTGNSLPLYFGLKAETHAVNNENTRDESHYFLVPYRLAANGYALYTLRRLPDGYAEVNSLPKWRIFHLPGHGSEHLLEQLVIKDMVDRSLATKPVDTDNLPERLNAIADRIDKESKRVTGGLLIIGGTVAIFNPLVGLGIAAHALFPSIAGTISIEGMRYISSKWKKSNQEKEKRAEIKTANKEVAGWHIVAQVNPLLQVLERALRTQEKEYDPSIEFDFDFDRFEFKLEGCRREEILILTARIILQIYGETISDRQKHAAACLGPEDLRFLEILKGFEN